MPGAICQDNRAILFIIQTTSKDLRGTAVLLRECVLCGAHLRQGDVLWNGWGSEPGEAYCCFWSQQG